nr:hypothetical protein [Micromonospora sp. DSM 115978]
MDTRHNDGHDAPYGTCATKGWWSSGAAGASRSGPAPPSPPPGSRSTGTETHIGYGPWGWPSRRTPLAEITDVWTERRFPSQVGGWGYRGLPSGNSTLMIRAGECLVIRRRSGAEFSVTVDDAGTGAALLAALRQHAGPAGR